MKLKCLEHGRRVQVLPNQTVLHREDGTHCDGIYLTMIKQPTLGQVLTPDQVVTFRTGTESEWIEGQGRLWTAKRKSMWRS